MPGVLVILDRPFRGVIEREFADAVHLARVCALQFDPVTILLTGEGVLLAAVPAPGVATRPPAAQHSTANLHAAAADGIHVLVDAAAADTFDLPDAPPPFRGVRPEQIAAALTEHDHVWYA